MPKSTGQKHQTKHAATFIIRRSKSIDDAQDNRNTRVPGLKGQYLPQREYCRTVCRCRGGEREHGFEMLDEKYIQVQGASKKNPWMN